MPRPRPKTPGALGSLQGKKHVPLVSGTAEHCGSLNACVEDARRSHRITISIILIVIIILTAIAASPPRGCGGRTTRGESPRLHEGNPHP